MSYDVIVSHEARRGCGYRQPGGKYLVSGGTMVACDRLPVEVGTCPVCHAGIKPARGWTWVDADALLAAKPCRLEYPTCRFCPLCARQPVGKAGLLWIGEKFYPTPEQWLREADAMGASRRLSQIPRDFKVGETLVLVAHRKAIADLDAGGERVRTPGIFHAFIPTGIDYIVKADDPADKLERLAKHGIRLVRVIPVDEQGRDVETATA